MVLIFIIGIREKLDYVKKTVKANSIWLNPIYESPGKDLGYDISDFKAIDPLFGTMADFDDLRLEMHNKGKGFSIEVYRLPRREVFFDSGLLFSQYILTSHRYAPDHGFRAQPL